MNVSTDGAWEDTLPPPKFMHDESEDQEAKRSLKPYLGRKAPASSAG